MAKWYDVGFLSVCTAYRFNLTVNRMNHGYFWNIRDKRGMLMAEGKTETLKSAQDACLGAAKDLSYLFPNG